MMNTLSSSLMAARCLSGAMVLTGYLTLAGQVPADDLDQSLVPDTLLEVQQALPPVRSVARDDLGGPRANWSDTPFMIGDSAGPMPTGWQFPGYAVGFDKLAENASPIPRDRVYMNYSYIRNANFFGESFIRNANFVDEGADVNRFMPGFEKTFSDGWTSIEVRTPFAATLDNFQELNSVGSNPQLSEYRDVEFGNMSVIFKALLFEERTWAISAGVQVMLPTAANTFVDGPSAAVPANEKIQQVFVANESVHLMPFIGAIWAPNDRFFSQAFFQVDTDVNGNLAYVNSLQDPTATGRSLQQAGRAYYPTFMYLSLGTGYWLYKNDRANFTGFSPVMELHINQAFEDFQPIDYAGYQLGENPGLVSVVNGLVGCNFEWGTRSTLSFAYVTPLGGGVDRFFDGELRAMYNWRFGPQNRLTRAQF